MLRTFATTVFMLPGHGVLAHLAGSAIDFALRTSMSGLCQSGPPVHGLMPGSGRWPESYLMLTTALSAAVDTTVTVSCFCEDGSISS